MIEGMIRAASLDEFKGYELATKINDLLVHCKAGWDEEYLEKAKIVKIELEELESSALLLECLRRNGVDNWDGWGDAVDDYDNEYENKKSTT